MLFTAMYLPVGVAVAAVDKFEPYAFARAVYDSNVFRVSGDSVSEDNDTIGHLGGGVNTDLKLSRQHLLLDLEVDRAIYDNLSDLDHTRIDGVGTWAWQVGNLWSGNLGYQYLREMSSFNEQLTREKDMRTTKTGFFNGGYQLHPDWRLEAGVEINDISYQDRDRLDRDSTAGTFEVQYQNTRNSRVGVRVRYTDNDLQDEDVLGVIVSNDYTETEISGVFYWEGTGKSAFEARLGYTDQSFDERNDRDFQGTTGRLTYHWIPTGKTKVDLSVWRETSTLFNEITTYVLTKGVQLRPSWSVTSKVTAFGDLAFVKDDFKGQNDLVAPLGGPRRDDDTWRFRAGARWEPRDYLQVSLSYGKQKRDSSLNTRDFDVDQVDAKVKFDF